MDSREIVRRTIDFTGPERVARSFEPVDFVSSGPEIFNPSGEWRRTHGREWQRKDEWGNTWARLDDTSKGEIVHGALDDLAQVNTFHFPDFDDLAIYASARRLFAENPQLWHIGGIHGFAFSIARKLRRMEQYLMDILLEPEKIARLHDRIDEVIKAQVRRLAEAGADSIMIAEDWGTQTQLLISPRLWRQEFKPRFARLCAYIHSLGMSLFMHSCGKMTVIIPDLIECGVDLLQFDQPRVHGIDYLSRLQETSRISYWCPVDIQTTLQSKDAALIRQEARMMIDRLWRGRGGFIAGYYSDNASIGLEPIWQEIASQEFSEYGQRKDNRN
jgi:uroporphyrinogen decarboxylase